MVAAIPTGCFAEDHYRNLLHEAFPNQLTDDAQDASARVSERYPTVGITVMLELQAGRGIDA